MDDLDRFFPVIPRNAPPDNLDQYLQLYASEAGAFLASQRSTSVNRVESYVNTTIPRMRTLEGLGQLGVGRALADIGQPLGLDPNRITDSNGNSLVSAIWIQRGINALRATDGQFDLLAVDGIAGDRTQTNLRRLFAFIGGGSTGIEPVITNRGTRATPGTVRISPRMQTVLANARQVADPPVAPRTTTPAPSAPEPEDIPLFAPPPAVASSSGLLALGAVAVLGWMFMR